MMNLDHELCPPSHRQWGNLVLEHQVDSLETASVLSLNKLCEINHDLTSLPALTRIDRLDCQRRYR